jgi:hypothetical protein
MTFEQRLESWKRPQEKMNTPWGYADQIDTLADGVLEVSTPSHGGILVHNRHRHYFPQGLKLFAGRFGEYLAFEEDCDAAWVFAYMWNQLDKRRTAELAARGFDREYFFGLVQK